MRLTTVEEAGWHLPLADPRAECQGRPSPQVPSGRHVGEEAASSGMVLPLSFSGPEVGVQPPWNQTPWAKKWNFTGLWASGKQRRARNPPTLCVLGNGCLQSGKVPTNLIKLYQASLLPPSAGLWLPLSFSKLL